LRGGPVRYTRVFRNGCARGGGNGEPPVDVTKVDVGEAPRNQAWLGGRPMT